MKCVGYICKIISIFCLTFISLAQAQEDSSDVNAEWKAYLKETQALIQKLTPSYTGNTEDGNTYQIVMVLHKKDWLFIVSDSLSFQSYLKLHKSDTLRQNSPFFDNNLGRLVENYLEVTKKPKEYILGELVFDQFYEVTRQGKGFYESIVEVETGKKFPGFWAKVGGALATPVEKLLGLEKIKEQKDAIEAQKKAIEEQKKKIEEFQTKYKDLEAKLSEFEALQKELEELKKKPWEAYADEEEAPAQNSLPDNKTPVDSSRQQSASDTLTNLAVDPPKNPEDSLRKMPSDSLMQANKPSKDSLIVAQNDPLKIKKSENSLKLDLGEVYARDIRKLKALKDSLNQQLQNIGAEDLDYGFIRRSKDSVDVLLKSKLEEKRAYENGELAREQAASNSNSDTDIEIPNQEKLDLYQKKINKLKEEKELLNKIINEPNQADFNYEKTLQRLEEIRQELAEQLREMQLMLSTGKKPSN